jgi:type II secretory pathway pseudopilin PulG
MRSLRQRGLTLIEMTVSIGIMLGALLLVQELIGTTQAAQLYIRARDRAAQQSARLISDLRSVGLSSRRLYQDDAEGRAYLAALNTAALPIMGDTKLPVVDPAGRLEPDAAGQRRTGDALLIACEDRPREFNTAGGRFRVDVVRFFAAYLTRRPGKVVAASADRIDLVRFASRPFADLTSLNQVPTASRAEVVQGLRAAGIMRAWVTGAPVASAFFALNADGTIDATPVATPTIDTLPDDRPRPMLGESNSSIAPNSAVLRVPAFAEPDPLIPQFPSGFEVKVVGPSGGRQVLVRLTILTGAHKGPDAASMTERMFSVRDL